MGQARSFSTWTAGLDIPLMSENPHAEVLYWVGCMGSFDRRNQKVATAVAKILKAAHVNFAILGPEESCTGDPARRIGNEYLWQMMAQQNIEVLNGYGLNVSEQQHDLNGHIQILYGLPERAARAKVSGARADNLVIN